MCMKNTLHRFLVVFRFTTLIAAGVFALPLNAQTVGNAIFPEDKSQFHIFLLMGQSNMQGGSSIDGKMDTETDSRILKLNASNFWEVAEDPITNDYDVAVGPGFQFAKTYIEQHPDVTVGLIPLAEGGTHIAYWSKPSGKYDESIYMANLANRVGTLKGILWHQGEADTGDSALAYAINDNLRILIDDIRMDLQTPYLPFLIGGLSDSEELLKKNDLRRIVNNRLKEVGETFYFCDFVPSKGVPYIFDNQVHFTSDGQRIMGERYANAYLGVVGFWTEKGKEWLDSEAEVDEESGWKYHPELGFYYDEFWPLIKHAQLGWLQIDIDKDHVIRIDSPFIGKYRIMQDDGFEHAIYIFTEDLCDPEYPSYGVPIYVNLTREPGDPYVFYDHATLTYIDRLPGMTVIKDTWDLNRIMEAEYEQIQWAVQYLRNEIANNSKYWTTMRFWVDDVVYHRNFCNKIGWEGYHYANENETGNLRRFWMQDIFLRRLYEIDEFVRQSQDEYQNATNVLLSE